MPEKNLVFLDQPIDTFIKARALSKVRTENEEPNELTNKVQKLKDKFIVIKNELVASGLQGFSLGCVVGLGIGIVSAIQTRKLVIIPFSIIASSLFLSFLMTSSSLINLDVGASKRAEDLEVMEKLGEYGLQQYLGNCKEILKQNECFTKSKFDLLK